MPAPTVGSGGVAAPAPAASCVWQPAGAAARREAARPPRASRIPSAAPWSASRRSAARRLRSPRDAARSRVGARRSRAVRAFFLATFSARLSLPTFSSSITRFSYGAKPATSRISSRTIFTRFPSRCGARARRVSASAAAAGQPRHSPAGDAPPCARPGARQACACSRRGPSPGRRPVPSPS